MLLKKSQTARRQFACCEKSDRRLMIRRGLNHVTEVASEFFFRQRGPPNFYTIIACTAKRNFDHECKKTFSTASTLSGHLSERNPATQRAPDLIPANPLSCRPARGSGCISIK